MRGGLRRAGRGQVDGEERRDGTLLVKGKKYDARVVDILIVRGWRKNSIGRKDVEIFLNFQCLFY